MIKRAMYPLAVLLATSLAACNDPGLANLTGGHSSNMEGSGFVQSTSCHRSDWSGIYVTRLMSSNGVPLIGPGWLSCNPTSHPFDTQKTASYSSDTRELPEWIDFSWVSFDKSKKYSDAEYLAHIKEPGVTERVSIRQQIPQKILDEVREARRHQDPSGLPVLTLHVFFNWTEDGIKLTWATQHPGIWAPVEYGGYIPKNMGARAIELLNEGNSRYVPSGD